MGAYIRLFSFTFKLVFKNNSSNMAENKLPILPVFEDFAPGGLLEGIVIPDMGPIPKEVVKFMFGDENYPLTKGYTFRILTYLHEIFLWDVQYCDCLTHLLYKRPNQDWKDGLGGTNLSIEENVEGEEKKITKNPFSSYADLEANKELKQEDHCTQF